MKVRSIMIMIMRVIIVCYYWSKWCKNGTENVCSSGVLMSEQWAAIYSHLASATHGSHGTKKRVPPFMIFGFVVSWHKIYKNLSKIYLRSFHNLYQILQKYFLKSFHYPRMISKIFPNLSKIFSKILLDIII